MVKDEQTVRKLGRASQQASILCLATLEVQLGFGRKRRRRKVTRRKYRVTFRESECEIFFDLCRCLVETSVLIIELDHCRTIFRNGAVNIRKLHSRK